MTLTGEVEQTAVLLRVSCKYFAINRSNYCSGGTQLNKGFQVTLALWFRAASQYRCKICLYIKARALWESCRDCSKAGASRVLQKCDRVLAVLVCVAAVAGAPFPLSKPSTALWFPRSKKAMMTVRGAGLEMALWFSAIVAGVMTWPVDG